MSHHHTRPLWSALVLSLGLFVASCGGSSDPAPAPVGQVAGTVLASAGSVPVAGAKVSIGALSAVTGADGKFTIDMVGTGARVVLKVEATAFLDGITAVPVTANQTSRAAVRLVPVGSETTIDPAIASVVTSPGSPARVALPANALVVASTGVAAAGAATVRLTAIDPGADPQSMPGDFTTSAGDTIESFGAINVSLRDAAGARLDLKPGSTATIRIPLSSRSVNPPATIPLYYMNETTGLWVQEGSATLTGSGDERYYEGSVTHFTTWNADQPLETIFVNGCVVTDTGAAVTEAIVHSVGVDYSGSASDAVDAAGAFRVAMRKDGKASIYAEGANTSNTVVAGPSAVDVTLPACLVVGSAVTAPSIVEQPMAFTAPAGGVAYFAVVATGTRPLAYQWRRDGAAIAGARGDVHYIPAVALADHGAVYDVVVSNSAGSVTSAGATLSVVAPVAPTITSSPASLSVAAGASASFSVAATGTLPLSYQWQRNGVDIVGATAATYTIPVAVLADSGAVFRVRVSNPGGSVVSGEATLTVTGPVLSAPTITAQPQNASVTVGQTAVFTVGVTGSPAPTFQWRRNGTPITGATASSYTTPPAAATDDGAVFSVVVSNSEGSVTSSGATLTVTAATFDEKIKLLRLLNVVLEFADAGLVPFEATTDDLSAFINPATVCDSGTLSVTLNGAAVSAGQTVPDSGTLAGVAIACDIDGAVYAGSTSVAYNLTSRAPTGTATITATNMRLTSSFFDGSGFVVTDTTTNGSASLTIDTTTSGPNVISAATIAPAAGATIRSEVVGLTATFVGGSASIRTTEDFASGQITSLGQTFSNLRFSVGTVNYVADGAYEFAVGASPGGSGEVVLTGDGARIGRIFVDVDGQLKIEVDGVVQPFRAPRRPVTMR